jgi:hypothetical protein
MKDTYKTWQDKYYDDEMTEEYETKWCTDQGWGIIDGKGYIEDYSDEYYLKLKNGEIDRIR